MEYLHEWMEGKILARMLWTLFFMVDMVGGTSLSLLLPFDFLSAWCFNFALSIPPTIRIPFLSDTYTTNCILLCYKSFDLPPLLSLQPISLLSLLLLLLCSSSSTFPYLLAPASDLYTTIPPSSYLSFLLSFHMACLPASPDR